MKLTPLGDRVVLKQLEAEETTASGIVLPGQSKEKPQQAQVVAVGPGGIVDGKEVVMSVEVGQQVIYAKYSGTDVKLDDEEYVIVRQNDILAIVADEAKAAKAVKAVKAEKPAKAAKAAAEPKPKAAARGRAAKADTKAAAEKKTAGRRGRRPKSSEA